MHHSQKLWGMPKSLESRLSTVGIFLTVSRPVLKTFGYNVTPLLYMLERNADLLIELKGDRCVRVWECVIVESSHLLTVICWCTCE